MKKIFFPLVILLSLSFTTGESSLTKSERKFAIERFKNSKNNLLNAIKGLSTTQLNFKASPESWSIAECTEHIAISETMLYGMFEGTLKIAPELLNAAMLK